ncbi:MFS transporter [Candidatus Cardinium hertigii]|jgi:DHA3 family tetracycline resistance protein-like MFS transporter|uniref:MFS transporter n=1 Tax=Candidatus Cardinium hertigii TaxID=247481 RepID=A0A3N2QC52_9BACT|nr:MFS transporter [Candidatus Cardinium hertigii]ROT47388.1 MFS transporter [Candidatus Cardinium hertigii]
MRKIFTMPITFAYANRVLRNLGMFTFLVAAAHACIAGNDALFFLSRGMNYTKINALEVVASAGALLLEIPTGVIADRYGRKYALISSCILRTIAYLFVASIPIYGILALAYFCLGFGQSFQSGALNAWIAENITASPNSKAEMEYQFIVNRNFGNLGNIAGAIMGYFASFYSNSTISWWMAAGCCLLACLIMIHTKQLYPSQHSTALISHSSKFSAIALIKKTHKGLQILYSHTSILSVTLFTCLSQIGAVGLMKTWQPVFEHLLEDSSKLRLMYGSFGIMSFIANGIVNISSHISDKKRLITFALLSGLPILLFFYLRITAVVALCLYLVHVIGETAQVPIVYTVMHNNITGNQRATVESWYEWLIHLFKLAGFMFMGKLTDLYGYKCIYTISGLFFLLAIMPLCLMQRKSSV